MEKLIKQLVEASYTDGILNAEVVFAIADRLSRKHLKSYIHALKEHEKQHTVIVEVPSEKAFTDADAFATLFRNKKVRFQENPDLLIGVRIRDNDDVYNMNLQKTLERIATYAAE